MHEQHQQLVQTHECFEQRIAFKIEMRLNSDSNAPEIFRQIEENDKEEEEEMEIASVSTIGSLESSWFFGSSFIQIREIPTDDSDDASSDDNNDESDDDDPGIHEYEPIFEYEFSSNQVENFSSDCCRRSVCNYNNGSEPLLKNYIFTRAIP